MTLAPGGMDWYESRQIDLNLEWPACLSCSFWPSGHKRKTSEAARLAAWLRHLSPMVIKLFFVLLQKMQLFEASLIQLWLKPTPVKHLMVPRSKTLDEPRPILSYISLACLCLTYLGKLVRFVVWLQKLFQLDQPYLDKQTICSVTN
jgi:hypothetical protein